MPCCDRTIHHWPQPNLLLGIFTNFHNRSFSLSCFVYRINCIESIEVKYNSEPWLHTKIFFLVHEIPALWWQLQIKQRTWFSLIYYGERIHYSNIVVCNLWSNRKKNILQFQEQIVFMFFLLFFFTLLNKTSGLKLRERNLLTYRVFWAVKWHVLFQCNYFDVICLFVSWRMWCLNFVNEWSH